MSESETGDTKPKKNRKKNPILPEGPSIWMQMGIALAIFIVLSAAYSGLREYWVNSTEEVALSQIATDIAEGKVS